MKSLFAVILSVPRITPVRPSLAPPIIKSLISKHKLNSKIIDINVDFYNNFSNSYGVDVFKKVDQYLIGLNPAPLDDHAQYCYSEYLQLWAEKLANLNPKHFLISVFTWQAQKFVKDFLEILRKKTQAKIIVGGQGIGEIREQTSWIGKPIYAEKLKNLGLIDHWIKGDAETTIPLICKEIYQGPGIDSDTYAPWSKLTDNPIPDFDDLDLSAYHSGIQNGVIPLEISRGCVRQCNFCDWVTSGGGFRSKTGLQMFNEVKYYIEKYDVRSFYFNDALMNGSVKEFNKFNHLLVNYYRQRGWPDRSIEYSGHFIIRGPKHGWKKEYIELMGKAGAYSMVVGVETGSDKVRNDMNKGYSLSDLDYNMEEFVKHGIKLYMLIMVGYPTETREDFEETLNLLKRYQKYNAGGHISGVNLGQTFIIEEGAPIYYRPDKLDLVGVNGSDQPRDVFWMNPHNPTLTYKERIKRRIEAQELVTKLGYPIWRGDAQLGWLTKKYKDIYDGTFNEHQTTI
jgi:radical SAM superfamily enzyme YgiQ (UPF0313 family)